MPHTPTRPSSKSTIDIIFTTHTPLIASMTIDTPHSLISDHHPIFIELNTHKDKPPPSLHAPPTPHETWNIKDTTNWEEYRDTLSHHLTSFIITYKPYTHHNDITQTQIDNIWTNLKDIIHLAAKKSIGKKKLNKRSKCWWADDQVQLHHKQLIQSKQTYHQTPTPQTHSLYIQHKNSFKHACKEAKKKSWDKLCSSMISNPKIYWTHYKQTIPSESFPLNSIKNKQTNTLPSTPQESLNNLALHFQETNKLNTLTDPSIERIVNEFMHSPYPQKLSKSLSQHLAKHPAPTSKILVLQSNGGQKPH